ncbi:hypothetical protein GGQ13_003052 [Salinibacter ruber]|nr:hypothetical protein [Salinibacter ruber]
MIEFDSPVDVVAEFDSGHRITYPSVIAAEERSAAIHLRCSEQKMHVLERARLLSLQLKAEEEGVVKWDNLSDGAG